MLFRKSTLSSENPLYGPYNRKQERVHYSQLAISRFWSAMTINNKYATQFQSADMMLRSWPLGCNRIGLNQLSCCQSHSPWNPVAAARQKPCFRHHHYGFLSNHRLQILPARDHSMQEQIPHDVLDRDRNKYCTFKRKLREGGMYLPEQFDQRSSRLMAWTYCLRRGSLHLSSLWAVACRD